MSYTHRITENYSTQEGSVAAMNPTYTGDVERGADTSIAASTTDQPINLAWTAAKVQSLVIWASGACTIKVNSTSSPSTTLNVAANQMIMWGHDFTAASPIPGDVTALYVTNSGTSAVSLRIRVLTTV